jgi:hypothetical protein
LKINRLQPPTTAPSGPVFLAQSSGAIIIRRLTPLGSPFFHYLIDSNCEMEKNPG